MQWLVELQTSCFYLAYANWQSGGRSPRTRNTRTVPTPCWRNKGAVKFGDNSINAAPQKLMSPIRLAHSVKVRLQVCEDSPSTGEFWAGVANCVAPSTASWYCTVLWICGLLEVGGRWRGHTLSHVQSEITSSRLACTAQTWPKIK